MDEPPGGASRPPGAHVILVGLPGAGKSTVGALLANALSLPYVDLDAAIERRSGRKIAELFALDGEATFRAWEREATEALVGAPASVVAPGGGWMAQPGVAALLRPPGRIIHLRVSPAAALRRMGGERAQRPLLAKPEPLAVLERMAVARSAAYAAADAELDTEALTLQELVARCTALASAWAEGVG